MISPAVFIPALEKTGRIVDLDFYVLSFVLKLIRSWLDKGIEPVPISFNLSRLHFYNEQLVENIKELESATGQFVQLYNRIRSDPL